MTIKPTPNPSILDISDYDPMTDNLLGLDWLHQDQEWIDREGNRRQLVDLDTNHLINIYKFLLRRAVHLEVMDGLAALASPMSPNGEMAVDSFEEHLDRRADNPEAWLKSTPLMRRIHDLLFERLPGLVPAPTEEPF